MIRSTGTTAQMPFHLDHRTFPVAFATIRHIKDLPLQNRVPVKTIKKLARIGVIDIDGFERRAPIADVFSAGCVAQQPLLVSCEKPTSKARASGGEVRRRLERRRKRAGG
jgi:hypothetical protein